MYIYLCTHFVLYICVCNCSHMHAYLCIFAYLRVYLCVFARPAILRNQSSCYFACFNLNYSSIIVCSSTCHPCFNIYRENHRNAILLSHICLSSCPFLLELGNWTNERSEQKAKRSLITGGAVQCKLVNKQTNKHAHKQTNKK